MGKARRIYFVADIHGSEVCWRKFLRAATFYEVDTILVGGDVTGKALVPVIERHDGTVEASFGGRARVARTEAEVGELEANIRYNGFYPYRCDQASYERLAANPGHRDEVFNGLMADTLRDWLQLADERLNGTGIKALVMPGNDDGWYVDEVLSESTEIVNNDGRVIDLGEFQVLGFGPSNPTPWHTHREYAEEVTGGGEPVMVPVGSTAVRDFLEATQPMLSLHGHIHESRGVAQIGRTVAINPGSAYSAGTLLGAIVTVRDGEVVAHQLVTG